MALRKPFVVLAPLLQKNKNNKETRKKCRKTELISIANCSKPSVNQQRVKKNGISRLHGEISARDAHVIGCCARAACEREIKQDGRFKIKEGLHTLWATSRSCPAWRHDTLCSHLLPVLLAQRREQNAATQNYLICHAPSQSG
jgi:hypothetical protein